MLKALSFGIILAGLTPLSAAAENCGRWVSCETEAGLRSFNTKSYVYGETRDVEPWASDEVVSYKKGDEATAVAPALGASNAAGRVRQVQKIASDNEAAADAAPLIADRIVEFENTDPDAELLDSQEATIEFSAEEEAAVRAYLSEIDASRAAEGTEVLSGVTIVGIDDF